MNDFPVRPSEYPLAELLAMKNGPVKKFYLIKQFGAAIADKAGVPLLKIREYGCDDLVALLNR